MCWGRQVLLVLVSCSYCCLGTAVSSAEAAEAEGRTARGRQGPGWTHQITQDRSAEDRRFVIDNGRSRAIAPWNTASGGGGGRFNLPWGASQQGNVRQGIPNGKNNPPQRKPFKEHYPFDSEIRGEGFHSRIRFDPYGGTVPSERRRIPFGSLGGQTFGHWSQNGPRHPSSVGSSEGPGISPIPVGASFASAEIVSRDGTSIELFNNNQPSQIPHRSIGKLPLQNGYKFKPPPVYTTRPPAPYQPFLNPGSLAALLQGSDMADPLNSSQEQSTTSGKGLRTPTPYYGSDIDKEIFSQPPPLYNAGQISEDQLNISEDFSDIEQAESVNLNTKVAENTQSLDHLNFQETKESLGSETSENVTSFSDNDSPKEELDDYEYYDSLYDEFLDMYYDEIVNNTKEPERGANPSPTTKVPVIENTSKQPTKVTTTSSSTTPTTTSPLPTTTTTSTTTTTAKMEESTIKPIMNSDPKPTTTKISPTTETTPFIAKSTTVSKNTESSTSSTTTTTQHPVTTSTTTKATTVPTSTHAASSVTSKPEEVLLESSSTNVQEQIRLNAQGIDSTPRSTYISDNGRSSSPVSLAEVLQGMGMALPQLLMALKGHGMTLKDFTVQLAARRMTQREFKRAHGDLGKLLDMMNVTGSKNDKASDDKEEEEKPRPLPPWKTTKMPWKPSTYRTTTPTTTTTKITTTTLKPTTLTPTTLKPTTLTPTKLPPTFGFRPGKSNKPFSVSKVEFSEEIEEQEKGPIPIKLDIATLMKEKGLNAADMLHDLGSLFTFEGDKSLEKIETTQLPIKIIASTTDDLDVVSPSSPKPYPSSPKPYVPNNRSKTSLRPYRPQGGQGGSEVYRGQYGGSSGGQYGGSSDGRGIIRNRYATTRRTTRPSYQYKPLPPGAARPPGMKDFSSVLALLHNSTTTSEGEDISFNLPGFSFEGAIPGMETIVLTEKIEEPEKEYYDDDPTALNNSTKSAILAASILGGVAMLVFLAILLVVMYKNHVKPHSRSLRALPIHIPSDTSSAGTPPIYSRNVFTGRKGYKTSGFWGTLKKRFDPYSISSTPTAYH